MPLKLSVRIVVLFSISVHLTSIVIYVIDIGNKNKYNFGKEAPNDVHCISLLKLLDSAEEQIILADMHHQGAIFS